jgi:ABC-type sugar transport system permease subunit
MSTAHSARLPDAAAPDRGERAAGARLRRGGLRFGRRLQLVGAAFVLPALLFFLAFKFGPMLWAMELSLSAYDMVSAPRFVGLENYAKLAEDPVFRASLINTFVYIAGSTALITLAGLALALAINTAVPGARHCMTAMFLTNLMPIIAVTLVWRFLLHPFGLVNQLLQPFGVGRVDWLTDETLAMPAIIAVTAWRFAPYFMVVFLAGLLAIPKDYYEAAEIDGAGVVRRFVHVTLPLLMPTLFFVVVVSALLASRIFLMPYIMTGGGPGDATRVLSMLIYETGFSYLKMGEAAAISVVLFAIMLVFTVLQMQIFMRSERAHLR